MPVSVTAPRGLNRLAPALRALVAVVLRGERRRLGEVGILLADDARLRELNREWRGIDRATDVISFAYDERERDARALPVRGDLLVSMDRVHAQSRRYRVTAGAELARLVVHGALHLCGHDHVRAAGRRLMRTREQTALRRGRGAVRTLDQALDARAAKARP
jgi:probable rRNA maturation factor